jgi:hypothetical protein
MVTSPARERLGLIAFGSTRPIAAALAERGDAVSDRDYKADSMESQSAPMASGLGVAELHVLTPDPLMALARRQRRETLARAARVRARFSARR